MKRTTTFIVLLAIALLPNLVLSQDKNSDAIIVGENIAVTGTQSGQVRGYIHKGIFTYKGIPYAHAERFTAPEKPEPWKNVRSSLTYGAVCPIDATTSVNDEIEFPFHHDWGYPNEDCLKLNVWTPAISDQKKRPVMVWLHGGGFAAGSSIELPSYDGENLSRKGDVVVVSINHRLNVLGFLDLSAYGEKYKSSPNVGMVDIVAALQWVKDNIAQFGGDPDNVTIFGQSGGGGKVTTLMSAPSAKGLFQKAIVQSGSYQRKFMDGDIAKKIGAAMLEELHLQPSQVDSLQKISYERLNAAGKKALRKVAADMKAAGKPLPGFGLGWEPSVDGSFLPYQLDDPKVNAISKDVPLLVGSTKNEFFGSILNPAIRKYSMDDAKKELQKKYGDRTDAYIAAVNKAYPNTTKPSDYIDIDLGTFRPGVIRQANQKAAAGGAPVYMYMFGWQSPVFDGRFKAVHCMDIAFEFNNISRCEEMTGGGKDAYKLSDKMSHAWINFATTGNPNAKGLPDWPKYNAENGALMFFDNKSEIKYHHDKELLQMASAK
jgi:para-nitrobenzyl esterase